MGVKSVCTLPAHGVETMTGVLRGNAYMRESILVLRKAFPRANGRKYIHSQIGTGDVFEYITCPYTRSRKKKEKAEVKCAIAFYFGF